MLHKKVSCLTMFLRLKVFHVSLFINQIASPNTLTIQYMVLFSHLTVQLPSEVLSQKQELAVWRPAPFFCMMTQVTMYLNGLPSLVSWFKHCSTTLEVHWFTLLCWYAFPPMAPSTDSLIMLLTSSTTKDVSSADWYSSIWKAFTKQMQAKRQNSTTQIAFQYGGLVWWPKGLSNHQICSSQYPLLMRGERLFVFHSSAQILHHTLCHVSNMGDNEEKHCSFIKGMGM